MCFKISLFLYLFCQTVLSTNYVKKPQTTHPSIKIGIVGAGIAGLYAGLILKSVNIDFEILEAKLRPGGRFYTYRFFPYASPETCLSQAYFDAGPMRFPTSWLFQRQFGNQSYALINYLNAKVKPKQRLKVIDVIGSHPNNVHYFNGIHALESEVGQQQTDLFRVGISNGGNVPDNYAQQSGLKLRNDVVKPFIDAIDKNYKAGMQYLYSHDRFTFREYATGEPNSLPIPVLDYMPRGGYFRLGLTALVSVFTPASLSGVQFKTVEGGSSKIIDAMASLLTGHIFLGKEVKSVQPNNDKRLLVITKSSRHQFDHVILTPTLPVIRNIDLSRCNLSFEKRKAMEVFHYIEAVKVGLLFNKRWWQDSQIMRGKPFFGGESTTDLSITDILFPVNGLNCTDYPSVLLASYTIEDTAARMGGLSDKKIEKVTLDNLSEIFRLNVRKYYTGRYYVHRWKNDPHTLGAFRVLDSGHVTTYLNALLTPEANGRLHFGGDAPGIFTGWSHDSMTNAYHSVLQILKYEGMQEKIREITTIWGPLEDKWSFLERRL